uniref:Tandem C2 domains, nuclear n=1 Tax=Xiphophorus maculatus TaxID=8083 RepID=A0A3B5QMI9_XIPMA
QSTAAVASCCAVCFVGTRSGVLFFADFTSDYVCFGFVSFFQVIKIKAPPKEIMVTGELPEERTRMEKAEDYLISKQPPGGREVPFVVPTFKPTYVQPQSRQFSTLQPGLHSTYRPICISQQSYLESYCVIREDHTITLFVAFLDFFIFLFFSFPESIALSGDEQEPGKVCVRVRYQQDVEQVWITLVQCSDLVVHPDEEQKVGFKAILTVPKPIQFKTTLKEYHQNVAFMETFVFALRLQQLQSSALVLRLQTHSPRKRTAAECVLSLRQLGPRESEHWLDLQQPSKSSACHSELHLSTLFQPVSGRIQVKILAAQNLPPSSSPLSQVFFVKAEMHQLGQLEIKKKTRALKASGGQCRWEETFHFLLASLEHACSLSLRLYSRSSVRRKQCLGQVSLEGCVNIPLPEAVEQWKDTMAHPEKVVAAWHRLSPP